MTPSNSTRQRPIFTLRTSELAGRSAELDKLRCALDLLPAAGDTTLMFYIAGDGGMGKTRLLQWLDDHSFPAQTFCTEILDFYNSILRTDIDLIEHIYDSISPALEKEGLTGGFDGYRVLRERFRTQQLGAAGGDTGSEVINAFVGAWASLAEKGYRLVVRLDTAELLRFEDDPVRERFKALEPASSSKRWLLEIVDDDKKLPGVLFVVAGRKSESPRLYAELVARAGHGVADPQQHVIELEGLSRPGIDEYFEKLTEKLEQHGYAEQARQLREEIDADLRTAFHSLTGGSPIALALALQLFIDGDTGDLPQLLSEQLNAPSAPIADAQLRLQRALIKAIAEYQTFGAISIAVRYMALARKGLTPVRLRALLQRVQPKQPEIDFDTLFKELENQIFVKRLPDESLVLHDKVADWTEEGLYHEVESRTSDVYLALVEIYQQEIAQLDQEIDSLIPIADPIASIEEGENVTLDIPSSQPQDIVIQKNSQELQSRRRTRRNRVIEQMTYALHGNPLQGYKIYYELSEEAFNVGRMDYESQIRTEFLHWWDEEKLLNGEQQYINRNFAEQQGLTQQIIDADFAIRAVQREYNAETTPSVRFTNTVALINRIDEAITQGQFAVPPFMRTLLYVYRDTAEGQLAETEEAIKRVRDSFVDHCRQLTISLTEDESLHQHEGIQRFLILGAQAFAYYEHGFFHSNHGNHGEAIRNYTLSVKPYHELGFEIDRARSLNDKAYSLAMVGNSDSADEAIRHALNLRQRLGFDYLVGLSYNTFGIVQTMSERPLSAVRYCKLALRIFQGLNHEFGQMLAYRALSEAYRRNAELLPGERQQRLETLERALTASQSALRLARKLLGTVNALLVEVLDEVGCAYRDIAYFCWQNSDLVKDRHRNAYAEADKAFQEAIKIASTVASARNYLVDSSINLAYLHYWQIFSTNLDKEAVLEQAEASLKQAFSQMPPVYQDLRHPEHVEASRSLNVYLVYLAKAHGLLVTIANARLRLLPKVAGEDTVRKRVEDQLFRDASYTLYFCSLLQGNVRNVRRSRSKVYDALRTLPVQTLERFYQQSLTTAQSIGIPSQKEAIMQEYLTNEFGIA